MKSASKRQIIGLAFSADWLNHPDRAIPALEQTRDAGTMDDYDATYLNGTLVGSVNPENLDDPKSGWQKRRIYKIPATLLRPGGPNVLAIRAWNGNALTKGWKAFVRGPLVIKSASFDQPGYYAGSYRISCDPYLHRGW